jgi:hypothetical protein
MDNVISLMPGLVEERFQAELGDEVAVWTSDATDDVLVCAHDVDNEEGVAVKLDPGTALSFGLAIVREAIIKGAMRCT